ncbi:MAG: RNA polymerase sigma factor [Planctomycetota bacterium]|jgi:RNA polymerase sigma-70 factor (ECF subfamily)
MTYEQQQSGRIEELEVLYAQHGPHVLRYLHRIVGAKWAEDLLQDTFVQALSHLDRLRAVQSPRAWLFRIAHNMAMNTLRQKKMVTGVRLDELIQPASEQDQRLGLMRTAIAELPDKHRETILLKWYDQLSYEEIAQVLDISIGTVRSRLHHSLDKLRTRLDVEMAIDPQTQEGI